MKRHMRILSDYLAQISGIALGEDKEYLFEMRLKPLMQQTKCDSLHAFAEALPQYAKQAEFQKAFIEAMTTNESMFFRDSRPFNVLKQSILPLLKHKKTVEFWSCACAAGQEAYSLAILAQEAELKAYHILATDIDYAMIDRAKTGKYSRFEIQRGLKTEHMLRYFHCEDAHHWNANDVLKKNITFKQDNLLHAHHNKKYDVILCRYVLIYFDELTKKNIINMLRDCLTKEGILLLGSAETMPADIEGLHPHPDDRTIFTVSS